MESRSLDALIAARDRWDAAAALTPGVDRWCSRSPWSLGVRGAFADALGDCGRDEPVVGESERGWVALQPAVLDDRVPALVPMDHVWGFASPVVGPAPAIRDHARDVAAWLLADDWWRVAFLAGVIPGEPTDSALIEALVPHCRLLVGSDAVRCVASLGAGAEAWLSRRTASFRRNLRQAERRATQEGIEVELADPSTPHDVDRCLERLHAVERRSWKGAEGSGIESPEMGALYASIAHDLAAVGALRVAFARRDGDDIGFVLGGVLGAGDDRTYRGLQLSFAEEARSFGVGRLLQWHEIRRLVEERVHTYDLGMEMAYKYDWADGTVTTRSLLAVRQ